MDKKHSSQCFRELAQTWITELNVNPGCGGMLTGKHFKVPGAQAGNSQDNKGPVPAETRE